MTDIVKLPVEKSHLHEVSDFNKKIIVEKQIVKPSENSDKREDTQRYNIQVQEASRNLGYHEPNREDNVTFITFQKGNPEEYGVNGVTIESLLGVILEQFKFYREYQGYEDLNSERAMQCIEKALYHLSNRTKERIQRNVYGTTQD